jgi:hypothetical protein
LTDRAFDNVAASLPLFTQDEAETCIAAGSGGSAVMALQVLVAASIYQTRAHEVPN